ncbi:MAG: ATP cone domain-containing protein [Peptoniphilaceae bacterium]|nr:ATP cone domain-containing protein [Peptoniphilaceae bacterium]MDY6019179.1 ATP cone domain-containing protein [Anaerococcus sp.]
MQDLKQTIIAYYKEKNLSPSEISKDLEGIKLKVLDDIVDDDKEYVIKKSGQLEEYKDYKIMKSIENAAHDAQIQLNSSDINIISSSILKRMKAIERNVYPTSELKSFVEEALKKDGYIKVLKAYLSYVE